MIKYNAIVVLFYLLASSIVEIIIEPLQQTLVQNKISELDASWIFLPHGVRVLSVMLLGISCFMGLWFAAILHGYLFFASAPLSFIIITSLLSAVATIFAYQMHFKTKTLSLEEITLSNIIFLSITISLISSLLVNFYRWIANDIVFSNDAIQEQIIYFIGDNIGAVALFLFINFVRKILKKNAI